MSAEIVIEVDNLWKSFSYQPADSNTIKGYLLGFFSKKSKNSMVGKRRELYHGLSLKIHAGEVVAFLGRNGSGKSTLLKLLSGIYWPDQGEIKVKGRLSALIELGAGFHPDFTGRENVLIYGQILGLSRETVRDVLPQIIEFSELGEFVDQPVKYYSSGMYMRLAFSVAVMVNPDVLIIDEILSVGDYNFSQKSRKKMDEFKEKQKTICLVSHDLETVRQWATRVVVLDKGQVVFDGDPFDGVRFYLRGCAEEPVSSLGQVETVPSDLELSRSNLSVFQEKFLTPLMKSYPLRAVIRDTERTFCIFLSSISDLLPGGYARYKFLLLLELFKAKVRASVEIELIIYAFHNFENTEILLQELKAFAEKMGLSDKFYKVQFVPPYSAERLEVSTNDTLFVLDWTSLAHLQTSRAMGKLEGVVEPLSVVAFRNSLDHCELPKGEPELWIQSSKQKHPFKEFKKEDRLSPLIRSINEPATIRAAEQSFSIIVLNDHGLTCCLLNIALRSIIAFLAGLSEEDRLESIRIIIVGDPIENVKLAESISARALSRSDDFEVAPGRSVVIAIQQHGHFGSLVSRLSDQGIAIVGGSLLKLIPTEDQVASALAACWKQRSPKVEHVMRVRISDSTLTDDFHFELEDLQKLMDEDI
jgi:ABC-type polysaccharide/polyol phosphate transport system ATPase subunit